MKPLDFVKTKKGNIALVTEVRDTQGELNASIRFLEKLEPGYGEKNAWWTEDELTIIGSLPDLLSQNLSHPMGQNSIQPFALTTGENNG